MSDLSQVVCVRGDSFVISGPNGNVVPGGDHGMFVRDTRFLNRLQIEVDGTPPVHLAGSSTGGHRAIFHAYVPASQDSEVDPTIAVTRRRIVDGGMREEIDITNGGVETQHVRIGLRVGADFAYIFDVKHGHVREQVEPRADGERICFERPDGGEQTIVRLVSGTAERDTLVTHLEVAPGATATAVVEVAVRDLHGETTPGSNAATELRLPAAGVIGPLRSQPSPAGPVVRCSDIRFTRLIRRSVNDLHTLELRDPHALEDRFAAAGSPWFLTLFGRDSIWTAFMALPHDLDLARGTLRVLARRQGQRFDEETEEEPGKILHEVRRGALAERGDLPPFYYGTVDATPLFVVLVHEAWRWGLPDDEVRSLMPNVEAALRWMADHGDPDGDGFLEYVPRGERSLANQGWKDSADGVRYLDGRIARAPLALCEVQGYAYDAALRGAELLDRFDGDGQTWRVWAERLRKRFHERFWVSDDVGPYPAVALDVDGAAVDGLASNMGHLLMSGILDDEAASLVAARLSAPDMAPGWGLRTLSSRSGGYNPLSYHCGTIWPHDTAIAVWGLATTGHAQAAGALLRGLVRAAPSFNYRLPELFSGFSSEHAPSPVPYPAACRPQAWAAGGALLLVRSLLGVDADVPGGRVTVRPLSPAPYEWFEIRDLPLAGGTVDLALGGDSVVVDAHDVTLDLVVEHP